MPIPSLRACLNRFLRGDGEDLFQLALHRRNVGIRQIDLVDDRNNREPLFVRQMNVRHRLRLNALCRIDTSIAPSHAARLRETS